MTNANTIIADIQAEGFSLEDVKAALQDGAALAALGLTDEDREAVEEAHAIITRSLAECNEDQEEVAA